ncbi:MAG: hypothetical protein ACWGMZ_12595, partial [Thermoguttaceae bacterium]
LVFVTTLAMLCFAKWFGVQGSGIRESSVGEQPTTSFSPLATRHSPLHASYFFFLLLYLSLGLAILGKGPVGFLLPMTAMGLFLMIVNSRGQSEGSKIDIANSGWRSTALSILSVFHPKNFLRSLWQLRPLSGAIVVLAVALPWYFLVAGRTNGAWTEEFFAKFNLRPFMQPIQGHSGHVWYHIPAVLIGFLPWSVFLGPATIDLVRRIRQRDPWRDGYILALCWFGVFFVFWSICSTKLPHYLLPAYPALALMTAGFIVHWIDEPTCIHGGWLVAAWVSTILAGLFIIVTVPVAAWIYLPGEQWLGALGAILIIGGGLCWRYSNKNRPERAAAVFAVMSILSLTTAFGFAAQRIDQHKNAKRLCSEIRADGGQNAAVCAYRFFRQSMVFYAGHPISYCKTPEELDNFLTESPQAYIITLEKYAAEIAAVHPSPLRELTRQRRFLATDNMIVLTTNVTNAKVASQPTSETKTHTPQSPIPNPQSPIPNP